MTAPYSDLGQFLATAALTAVAEAIGAAGLDPPSDVMVVHGTGIPIEDVCNGLLWARVAAVYPTNGDANPFLSARIDFDLPAWAHTIDVGILFCRTNITEEGASIDPDDETALAVRDSGYRMALLDGLANHWPALIKPCALGFRFSLWTPVGPDGAVSGGFVQVTVVAGGLAVAGA